MTTRAERPLATRYDVSLLSRIDGFASVYSKTVRDSRLAFLVIAGLLGGMMLAVSAGISSAFQTVEARQELAAVATNVPPILQGMAGRTVNVDTLGGYLTYKYGLFFPVIVGLWSILALSGTLATEARRGSLEFIASAPFGKTRLALEKIGAHVTVLTAAMVVLALATYVSGAAFGRLPGDAIPLQAAIGYALFVGLLALASGAVAFALAPFLGRATAGGIAGFVMFGGWLLNGYQVPFPVLAGPANLTWFSWTSNHLPLAGQFDWVSLVPVAIVAVGLLAVGVEAFSRRDIGATSATPGLGLPRSLVGLRGPVGRSFGERLPAGLAWGIGLGVYGLVIAAASRSFTSELLSDSPQVLELLRTAFPNFDTGSAGGFLQLMFVQFGFIVIGFAAVTLVSGWASDETSGRLEMLLATPQDRARWAIRSGIGVFFAIAILTAVLAVAVGLGSGLAGSDVLTPMAGSAVLGLYAAALAGIGFAIGGLFRTSVAAEAVAVIVTATFLIDLIIPALNAPDWVHQLALTAHMGQPMVGVGDVAGLVAALVLAVGGLALGAVGFARRDLQT